MKQNLLLYSIILYLLNSYPLFSSEPEQQTKKPVEISFIMENQPVALSNNIIVDITPKSNSISLLEDSNNILQLSHELSYLHKIPVTIDWSQIPEIGFPKNEIESIHIVERTLITYESNTISFSPNVWLFKTSTWGFLYKGRIPYLENLEFIKPELRNQISTKVAILREQNNLGYYQDSNKKPGIYFSLHHFNNNTISSIFIKDKEFAVNTNTTNTIEEQPADLNTTNNQESNITKPTEEISVDSTPLQDEESLQKSADVIDPSVNTSVEKRDKQKTKNR